jgi:flavin-dependent dehydrogenase
MQVDIAIVGAGAGGLAACCVSAQTKSQANRHSI